MDIKNIKNSVLSSIVFLGVSSILTIFLPFQKLRMENIKLFMIFTVLSLIATYYLVLFFFRLHKWIYTKYKLTAFASLWITIILSFSVLRSLWALFEQFIKTGIKINTGSPLTRVILSLVFSGFLLFFFYSMRKEYPIANKSSLDQSVKYAFYSMAVIVGFFSIIILKMIGIIPPGFLNFIFNKWVVIFIHILNFSALYYFFSSFFNSLKEQ